MLRRTLTARAYIKGRCRHSFNGTPLREAPQERQRANSCAVQPLLMNDVGIWLFDLYDCITILINHYITGCLSSNQPLGTIRMTRFCQTQLATKSVDDCRTKFPPLRF